MDAQFPGGLPAGTTEAEVEREFTKFGPLATVWVARKPPGFGEFSECASSAKHVTRIPSCFRRHQLMSLLTHPFAIAMCHS